MDKFQREFERVPTIEEIDRNDPVAWLKARDQYVRDRWVDRAEIDILRERLKECNKRQGANARVNCQKQTLEYMRALSDYKEKQFSPRNPRWGTLPPELDKKIE